MYLLIHFHCNLGYVFLSFDWIKTIIIIIIIVIIIIIRDTQTTILHFRNEETDAEMSGTFTGDAPLSCRRILVTFFALLA